MDHTTVPRPGDNPISWFTVHAPGIQQTRITSIENDTRLQNRRESIAKKIIDDDRENLFWCSTYGEKRTSEWITCQHWQAEQDGKKDSKGRYRKCAYGTEFKPGTCPFGHKPQYKLDEILATVRPFRAAKEVILQRIQCDDRKAIPDELIKTIPDDTYDWQKEYATLEPLTEDYEPVPKPPPRDSKGKGKYGKHGIPLTMPPPPPPPSSASESVADSSKGKQELRESLEYLKRKSQESVAEAENEANKSQKNNVESSKWQPPLRAARPPPRVADLAKARSEKRSGDIRTWQKKSDTDQT